jgi:ribosome-associated protein
MSETPTIRLDQFLKLTDVVQSGGEAKQLIQSGEVIVNGVVETRRKKQLQVGDEVQVGDLVIEVGLDD